MNSTACDSFRQEQSSCIYNISGSPFLERACGAKIKNVFQFPSDAREELAAIAGIPFYGEDEDKDVPVPLCSEHEDIVNLLFSRDMTTAEARGYDARNFWRTKQFRVVGKIPNDAPLTLNIRARECVDARPAYLRFERLEGTSKIISVRRIPRNGKIKDAPPMSEEQLKKLSPKMQKVQERCDNYKQLEAQRRVANRKVNRESEAKQAALVGELPVYPLDVRDNTLYSEFAELCATCGDENFIPREFFIEALKTVAGAVVGNRLIIANSDRSNARFYTILIGDGGAGKGTSIRFATSVFLGTSIGTVVDAPMIWPPEKKIEEVAWVNIGVCRAAFTSAPGLERACKKGQHRFLQIFEELSSAIESMGNPNSGMSLMAINRELYDGETYSGTGTGTRDAADGFAQNTILAGTTEDLWENMFAGKKVHGSGFLQRFNLIASDEKRRVADIGVPDLTNLKHCFAARLVALEKQTAAIPMTQAARKALNDWMGEAKFDNAPDDIKGRLNVLAKKNALHLAWLRDLREIGLAEIEAGIKLGDYEFLVRQRFLNAEGENQAALVEDKIRILVRRKKRVLKRDVEKSVARWGGYLCKQAIKSMEGVEIREAIEIGRTGQKKHFLDWIG